MMLCYVPKMGVDDRQHEKSEFHIYPQPHRIRSKRHQDAGEESVSPSLGSLFTYSGTFHFADLLDLGDIEGGEALDREKANEVLQRVSTHRNEIAWRLVPAPEARTATLHRFRVKMSSHTLSRKD